MKSSVRDFEELFKTSFDNAAEEYGRILEYFYPARGDNAFTERNQTGYFVAKLLTELGGSAFVWYEPPLVEREHMDAAVFVPDREAVVYIESKRIDKVSKTRAIIADVERMREADTRAHIINNARGWRVQNEYIVYLADVWIVERPTRYCLRHTLEWWQGENRDHFAQPNPLPHSRFVSDVIYAGRDTGDNPKHYHIMMAYEKLRE